MTLSKERLEQYIRQPLENSLTRGEVMQLAKMMVNQDDWNAAQQKVIDDLRVQLERRERDKQEPVGIVRYVGLGHRKGIHVSLYERLPEGVELYAAPPTPVVPDDYFASLVSKARPAAEKAMRKFPQPNYVLLKVAEEAGEVVQAGVHYAEGRMSWEQVEGEIVQLLAMLIRLVTEGDQINGVTPPEHTRAAAPQQEANQ